MRISNKEYLCVLYHGKSIWLEMDLLWGDHHKNCLFFVSALDLAFWSEWGRWFSPRVSWDIRALAWRGLYGGGRAGRGWARSGGGGCVRWAAGAAAGGGRGADGGRCLALLLSLQSLATYVVVLFPVLVLAEGSAVTRRVAAAAGLTRLAPAIPAALHWERGGREV